MKVSEQMKSEKNQIKSKTNNELKKGLNGLDKEFLCVYLRLELSAILTHGYPNLICTTVVLAQVFF